VHGILSHTGRKVKLQPFRGSTGEKEKKERVSPLLLDGIIKKKNPVFDEARGGKASPQSEMQKRTKETL